jgi:DNA invertase Pin-like site-specific DNA recombinase
MPKYHRIQIDDRAYKALIAESIGRDGVDIRDIASQILIDGVSKEALTYSGQFSATFDDEVPIEIKDPGPVSEAASPTDSGETSKEVAQKIAKKAPPTGGKPRGGKRKPVTDEQKAEVRRLKASTPDISNRKIAEMVKLSPAMVNNILSESKEIRD